jgi:hypothetical protein
LPDRRNIVANCRKPDPPFINRQARGIGTTKKKAQVNRPAPFKAWIGQMPHQGLTGASSSLSLTKMIAATPASKPTRPMIQLELPSRSLSPLTADPARAEAAAGAADAATGATTAEVAASATRIFRGVRIFFSVDEMG